MQDLLIFSGIVFMGFFAIMNPISSVSIFLALTAGEDVDETKKIAFQSVLTAFIIIFIFAVAGHLILKMFGISFAALRIAGGVLVAMIGYEMLQGHHSNVNRPTKETIQKTIKDEEATIAVTPLGIPLLAGPGTIITAMSFSGNGLPSLIITLSMFALLCVITYFSFISGKKLQQLLGVSTLKVITRMMGLILTVIGAQMLIMGVYGAVAEFPSVKTYFTF